MKTFLHYTKERELDEGILGTAARIAGQATRVFAKSGEIAAVSRQAFSGLDQGAKPGDFSKGASSAAGSIVDKAEKVTKEKGELAKHKADCVRRLNYYQKLLNNARSSGRPDGRILADMDRVKSQCAGVMKASTYDMLAKEREKEDRDIITDFDKPVAGKKGFDKYG